MRRFLLILAVVLFAMTAFAAIAPGLYRVNVNSTLNVRNAPEFSENFGWDNYWKLLSQVVKYKCKENTKQQNVPVEHQTEVMIYGS